MIQLLVIIKKTVFIVLIVFAVYILLCNVIPYALPKNIKDAAALDITTDLYERETNDKAALIESFDDAFNVRLALVNESKESIDIAYHIFEKGETSKIFLNALIQAAERGVHVRLLFDGKPSTIPDDHTKLIYALDQFENAEVAYYSRINLLKPWTLQSFLHDKIIIMDGEWILSGGRNIADRFFAPKSFTGSLTGDRDVLVKKYGDELHSVVDDVTEYFELLWNSKDTSKKRSKKINQEYVKKIRDLDEGFEKENPQFYQKSLTDYENSLIETEGTMFIHNPINASKKEPWVGHQIRQVIESAQSYVLIQTPYSTSNKKFTDMMNQVSVEEKTMITNSELSSPNFFAFSNYLSNRKKIIKSEFQIYEYYSTNSIHAKSVMVDDDISIIGSFNMDDRSLYLSTENMIIIRSEEFQKVLRKATDDLQANSMLVGADNKYVEEPDQKPSFGKKALMGVMSVITRFFRIYL